MNLTEITRYEVEITGTYIHLLNKTFCDLKILSSEVSGSKVENTIYENIIFESCNFQSTDFIGVKFIDCKFINCTFNFVKFKDCNLIACKIENCSFCITNSLNCNFLSCTYISNIWTGSSHQGKFIECHIDESEFLTMETGLSIITLWKNPTLQGCWPL